MVKIIKKRLVPYTNVSNVKFHFNCSKMTQKYMIERTWKQYPMSIDQAAEEVLTHLCKQEKQRIAKASEKDLIGLHYDIGLYIRNNLGVWKYYQGREDSTRHPDWESFFIIERLWEKLRCHNSQE